MKTIDAAKLENKLLSLEQDGLGEYGRGFNNALIAILKIAQSGRLDATSDSAPAVGGWLPCPFCGAMPNTELLHETHGPMQVVCSNEWCVMGNMSVNPEKWNARTGGAGYGNVIERDRLWCRAIIETQYQRDRDGHLQCDVAKLLGRVNELRDQPPQSAIPHKCPVCDGTGKVSRPPWVAGDVQEFQTSSAGPWQCVTCSGSGIIVLTDGIRNHIREVSSCERL